MKKLLLSLALALGAFSAFSQTSSIDVTNNTGCTVEIIFLASDPSDGCNNWVSSTIQTLPPGTTTFGVTTLMQWFGAPNVTLFVFHSAWVIDGSSEEFISVCGPTTKRLATSCGTVTATYTPSVAGFNDQIQIR